MPHDLDLTLDLIAEDLPAAERQARSLGLALERGDGIHAIDLYIPYTAPDDVRYLIRLRCDGYDEQWWARMANISYPRGDHGEVVYCTPGIREYHQLSSHRQEAHPKSTWKLARVVALVWQYLYHSGLYVGRGGV